MKTVIFKLPDEVLTTIVEKVVWRPKEASLLEKWIYEGEERKTGRWIVKTDCEGKTRTIVCPFCGWEHGKYKWTNDNFCGGCGAKMEGAEE